MEGDKISMEDRTGLLAIGCMLLEYIRE